MPLIYDKNNPFHARLIERRRLSSIHSQKDTQHFSVSLAGSGLTYKCGDSLGVFPTNNPRTVEALLYAAGFTGEEIVIIGKDPVEIRLREALLTRFALNGPTYKFAQLMQECAQDSFDKDRLAAVIGEANPEKKKYWIEQREFIDFIVEFPSARLMPQQLVDMMRKLMPRLYSISSAPSKFPNEIHLTVAVVRYETNGQLREGVCSTFLSERVRMNEADIPVFITDSHFGLPTDNDLPIIMVGPGTGVAPFRSFVMERAFRGAKGKNWLFFGDQHHDHDFLYADEWKAYLNSSALTRLDTAFSRDQTNKIYVQDRLREHASEIWRWFQNGAYFYVCGDAKSMAKDVDATLHSIVMEQGQLSPEAAVEWVKKMKKDGRYQRDVY